MDQDKILQLTAKIDTMPTLPAIVNRVLAITADPDSSAQDLLEVIESDQTITAKILKMANSAYYSRAREIATLKQALVTIGFDDIRNMVLSIAVFNNYVQLKNVKAFDAQGFWRHSFTTGLAAKILAGIVNLPDSELFVAGLIHDIGKLALLMAAPSEFAGMLKDRNSCGLDQHQAEKDIFGLNHCEVGFRLLKKWRLPNQMVAAVGFHHDPAQAEASVVYPLMIHLSDCLAHAAETPPDTAAAQNAFSDVCFSGSTVALTGHYRIDWRQEVVEGLVDQLKNLVEKQQAVFEMLLSM